MSSKGTGAFIALRATSVLLLPFTVWFVWSVVAHAGDGYDALRAWMSGKAVATVFALFIALSAYHMRLGLNEVIEDYVHSGMKGVFMTLNALAAAGVAGLAFYGAWLLAFQG